MMSVLHKELKFNCECLQVENPNHLNNLKSDSNNCVMKAEQVKQVKSSLLLLVNMSEALKNLNLCNFITTQVVSQLFLSL